MVIILIAIFLLFLLRANAKQRGLSVGIGIVLFLISVGKDIFSNGDLMAYRNGYLSIGNVTLGELWTGYFTGAQKDFGYYALSKVFAELGFGVEVWFGIIALIFAVCAAVAFYKNSSDPFISVVILLTFYFSFTLSGLRQTIAMGLVLLSYRYIKERKLKEFLILLGVAFLFHSSVLIFLPAYWLLGFRVGFKQLIVVGVALFICVMTPGVIRAIMANIAWVDRFHWYLEHGEGLNWSGYIIQLFLLIFCYVFRMNIPAEKRTQYVDPYINLMVIGLCLQGASGIVGEAFRLSYYYAMASMFAIPNIITNMERKNAKLAYIGVCGVLALYIVYGDYYSAFHLFGV